MRKLAIALLLVPEVLFVIACSRPPEQQFLTQFFRAARGRDNTTVGRMSAVEIDPRLLGKAARKRRGEDAIGAGSGGPNPLTPTHSP